MLKLNLVIIIKLYGTIYASRDFCHNHHVPWEWVCLNICRSSSGGGFFTEGLYDWTPILSPRFLLRSTFPPPWLLTYNILFNNCWGYDFSRSVRSSLIFSLFQKKMFLLFAPSFFFKLRILFFLIFSYPISFLISFFGSKEGHSSNICQQTNRWRDNSPSQLQLWIVNTLALGDNFLSHFDMNENQKSQIYCHHLHCDHHHHHHIHFYYYYYYYLLL